MMGFFKPVATTFFWSSYHNQLKQAEDRKILVKKFYASGTTTKMAHFLKTGCTVV